MKWLNGTQLSDTYWERVLVTANTQQLKDGELPVTSYYEDTAKVRTWRSHTRQFSTLSPVHSITHSSS